jgi:hypothetical protein
VLAAAACLRLPIYLPPYVLQWAATPPWFHDPVLLETIAKGIDELIAGDHRAELASPEQQKALNCQLARLYAVACSSSVDFEDSLAYAMDGSRSAAAWLALHCRISDAAARRQLRLGKAMRLLPVAAAAFFDGEIGSAQMGALEHLARGRCAVAVEESEEWLVEQARALRVDHFEKVCSYFEQHADPDGSDERAEKRRARRDASLVQSLGGMWLGTMTLDPIEGEVVYNELSRLEQFLFEHDRAEAAERLGRAPLCNELPRSSGQRRADALSEMARRSAALPEGAARPAPLFSVFVGYETLSGRICELASGTVVSPGSLLPYLDEAVIERAVFTPAGRVELGGRRRLFDGATRRAIELRDRGCVHPSCRIGLERCQVDHVIPYSAGGETLQENGRLACPAHNRFYYRRWLGLDEAARRAVVAEHLAGLSRLGKGTDGDAAGGASRERDDGEDRPP